MKKKWKQQQYRRLRINDTTMNIQIKTSMKSKSCQRFSNFPSTTPKNGFLLEWKKLLSFDFYCDQNGARHQAFRSLEFFYFFFCCCFSSSNGIESKRNLCVIITHIVFSVWFQFFTIPFCEWFFLSEFFHSLSVRSSLTVFLTAIWIYSFFDWTGSFSLSHSLSLIYLVKITNRDDGDDDEVFTWFYGNVSLNIHIFIFTPLISLLLWFRCCLRQILFILLFNFKHFLSLPRVNGK